MPERRKPLTQLEKEDYCDLVRKGHLRYEAAAKMDVSVRQVEYAARQDPDFRADLEDAQREAIEPVESALHAAAASGEPWACKFFLSHAAPEKWGDKPTQVHVTHALDGQALLLSVATLAQELEMRRMHANSIATGGKLVEPEPVPRGGHPVVYELGKGPVIHSHAKELINKTRGMPRRPPTSDVQDVASPLLNDLPRRPGT